MDYTNNRRSDCQVHVARPPSSFHTRCLATNHAQGPADQSHGPRRMSDGREKQVPHRKRNNDDQPGFHRDLNGRNR